jgi:hypothetical protein
MCRPPRRSKGRYPEGARTIYDRAFADSLTPAPKEVEVHQLLQERCAGHTEQLCLLRTYFFTTDGNDTLSINMVFDRASMTLKGNIFFPATSSLIKACRIVRQAATATRRLPSTLSRAPPWDATALTRKHHSSRLEAAEYPH